ncbi:hypothetical protein A3759_02215 [Thalassolituus sp. HI0120]|nr:hypothetical protein A3759_02215 [Thalassolituus sp. HI0120]
MKLNKNYLAMAIASAALVGCGSDDNDSNNNNPAPTAKTYAVQCATDTCTVTGTINEDLTFTADKTWVLGGFVNVGTGGKTLASAADVAAAKEAGVTLTIEAGTNILAANTGSLLVTRGSKLMAEGTAAAPITFSSIDEGFDGEGEWGGVIVQGFAPQYGQGGTGACFKDGAICNVEGEGGSEVGNYGGEDAADNSGVIKYVRIAEGGYVAGPNDEINGLTLQGVGHGTTVEYVQVHNNLDDGIEWFGGTVNVKYAVLTNNDDDDVDFDEGYKGNIQHVIIRKHPNKAAPTGKNDPRGIEANSSDDEYVPETEAAVANVTIQGSAVNIADNSKGDGKQPGMRLRGALTVAIYNSAVTGFDDCVRVDDANTDGKDDTQGAGMPAGIDAVSNVSLVNVIGNCDDKFYAKRNADTETGTVGANAAVAYDAAWALPANVGNVAAPTLTAVDNGSGFAFDSTDYIGAVKPGTAKANAWYNGWVIPGSLDQAAE